MITQLRPIKEKDRELLLQRVSFKSVNFPKCSHISGKKKKSLNNCSTDKFAKNNTELNNPVLTQCEKTRSAFQVKALSFAQIMQYILQGTNDS